MMFILKLLSILVISAATFNIVACKNSDTTEKNVLVYDVKFEEIESITANEFNFDSLQRNFLIFEENVISNTKFPKNMWENKKAYFYVKDDKVWDKVASFYGFNRKQDKTEIKTTMLVSLISKIFMRIEYVVPGKWNLLDVKGNI